MTNIRHRVLAAAILVIFLSIAYVRWHKPFFYAYLALAAFYGIAAFFTGNVNPLRLALGADGRLSTSKFQFLMWTATFVFSYVLLISWRGRTDALSAIPVNVLLAMGFSTTTLAGAKAITVSYLTSGQIAKTSSRTPNGDTSLSALIAHDDSSAPDLTKVQMLIWTGIAVVVYLIRVYYSLESFKLCGPKDCVFPDIDTSLMVLMGISHGAYLGNKLVASGSPQIWAVSPSTGAPGTLVILSGDSFGASQNGSVITLNGQSIAVPVSNWNDSAIQFSIPSKRPDGTSWSSNEQLAISAVIAGQNSGTATFTIAKPVIDGISPNPIGASGTIVVRGRNFGAKIPSLAKVTVQGVDLTSAVASWSDTQIAIPLDRNLPNGATWATGIALPLQVQVGGLLSDIVPLKSA